MGCNRGRGGGGWGNRYDFQLRRPLSIRVLNSYSIVLTCYITSFWPFLVDSRRRKEWFDRFAVRRWRRVKFIYLYLVTDPSLLLYEQTFLRRVFFCVCKRNTRKGRVCTTNVERWNKVCNRSVMWCFRLFNSIYFSFSLIFCEIFLFYFNECFLISISHKSRGTKRDCGISYFQFFLPRVINKLSLFKFEEKFNERLLVNYYYYQKRIYRTNLSRFNNA